MFFLKKTKTKGLYYILAGRDSVVESVYSFYKEYKFSEKYPLYIFYFNQNLSSDVIERLKLINTKIHLKSIKTKIPSHIEMEELFYNRKYLGYVNSSFKKNRIEFLHMCDFLFNIFNSDLFQDIDFALRWDDDGLFRQPVTKDYFKILSKSGKKALTGKLNAKYEIHHFETRINLFKTLIEYLDQYSIKPKCDLIRNMIDKFENSETLFISEYIFHKTKFMSDFNVYNMSIFRNNHWQNWNKHINESGGIYKYRWGENELITLFILIHYGNTITDLELWPHTYDPKGADSESIFKKEF